VFVTGEPGIGKTHVLAELVRRAEHRGCLVLEGGAAEYEEELPFGVVIDALDAYMESLGRAVVDRYIHLGARAGLEVPASLSVLAERLDPSVLSRVETWALALAGEDALRRRVRTLAYALSLRAVIRQEFP
jgi:hypothetical protein